MIPPICPSSLTGYEPNMLITLSATSLEQKYMLQGTSEASSEKMGVYEDDPRLEDKMKTDSSWTDTTFYYFQRG